MFSDGRFGQCCRYDLYHAHERDRVEEMQPRDPLRPGAGRGDVRDQQRGSIARQDGISGDDVFQFRKQLLLDIQQFHDRLDDDPAGCQSVHAAAQVETGEHGVRLAPRVPALVHLAPDHFADEFGGGVQRAGLGVVEPDRVSGLEEQLGNPAPHDASADDADMQVAPCRASFCLVCHYGIRVKLVGIVYFNLNPGNIYPDPGY